MKPRSKSVAKKNCSNQTYLQAIYLATLLLSGSAISWHCQAWAAPLPPNTTIDNTATGSFVDELDLTNTEQTVTSNTVTLKVGEVAGITIVPQNTPTATTGSVANFDFTVTNVGNDPTKFLLPTAPSSITGGTPGTLQVVGYIPAGGAVVNLTTPIDITTETNTGALSDPTLGGNTTLGSIPVGAAIVVRVPVTVTATAGNPVSVTLGNTAGQPSTNNTPYILGANGTGSNDLYTFDNADNAVTGEASGSPINGDATGHRQEASSTKTVNASTSSLYDYGDAPDTYGTDKTNNSGEGVGASHVITSTLKLGTTAPDAETDAQTPLDGTGDGADEDAFTSLADVSTTGNYNLTVPVTNSGSSATLHAWLDFNKNGKFEVGEYQSATVANGATTASLSWTVPSGTTAGNTYARFRLTSDAALVDNATTGGQDERSIGAASDGEVEDYKVAIATPIDWGSAPSNLSSSSATPGYTAADVNILDGSLTNAYPTMNSQNGAQHTIDGNTYLGNSVNAETDGQPNFQAGSTDDDGVTFPKIDTTNVLLSGQSNTITVNASVAGKLNAWIDWNQDGQWQATEQIATDLPLTTGNNTLPITVANTYPHGVTYARFRFSTQSGLQPTGSTSNGEVEDYKVNIVAPSSTACSAGLINGGFESPATQPRLQDFTLGIYSYREAYYPGWSFRSLNPNATENTSSASAFDKRNALEIWPTGALSVPAAAGSYFAEINAYFSGNIYQDIQTTPGTVLSWKFSHRGRLGNDTLQLKLGSPGATVQVTQVTTGNTAWKTYTGTYTIPPGQYITRLEFEAVSAAGGDTGIGNFIDDVSFGLDCSKPISGTVFEDPNYGGGAGRPLSATATSPRDGATVELYKSDGSYISNTTTSGGGKYTFNNVNPGDYFVRVVNSSVTSSRGTGSILPVQTFRVNDSTGTPADDVNRVGGEKPSVADTGAAGAGAVLNTTTFAFTTAGGGATVGGQAQSIAPVKVGSSAVTGIDFGYNFDTIVNTNDSGQGSLRQFITNSNTLTNTGLAQVGQPAGKEVSIFMIPGQAGLAFGSPTTSAPATGGLRIGLANQLTNGVAKIAPTSVLPSITDNNTSIDGTTQTTFVGDTNSGQIGTGGKVGTGPDGRENTGDEPTLSLIDKPEVEIKGNGSSMAIGLDLVGNNETVRGIAIYGFGVSGGGSGSSQADVFSRGTGEVIQSNTFGFPADSFADPGAASRTQTNHIELGLNSETTITNNMIAFALHRGIDSSETQLVKINITNNEIRENNRNDGFAGAGIELSSFGTAFGGSASNSISPQGTISGNLITKNTVTNKSGADNGIEFNGTAGNLLLTIEDNTISNNGTGIVGYSFKSPTPLVNNITISHNVITDNYGSGIGIRSLNGLKITQNAIYKNIDLGIDLLAGGNNGAYTMDTSTNRPGNDGIDYPIITNSTLSAAGVLTVSGFVGSNPSGSATFANANLEFFIAFDDGDNTGEVILGDGKSKAHGEGKTYLSPDSACKADANGKFTCTFSTAGTLGLTNANNITATATNSAGSTSQFSAPTSNAKVLLVKRITAINGATTNPNDGTVLSNFVDDGTAGNEDNNANWPTNFLKGAINAGKVKPGDTIQYTIYFLNADLAGTNTVKICDRITGAQSIVPPAVAGTPDIKFYKGGDTTYDLTSASDAGDRAALIPTASAPNSCHLDMATGGATDTGTLVVDVTGTGNANQPDWPTVAGSAGQGTAGAYGSITFTTTVNP